MAIGIGGALRKARSRRNLGLPEVEAATKIRVRFLRALENEEWDALPGDVYARSFIRTYASYLGLDGERLANEYRRDASAGEEERAAPGVEAVAARRSRVPALSPGGRRAAVAAIAAALAGVAIAIGLATGEDEPAPSAGGERRAGQPPGERPAGRPDRAPEAELSLELTAAAEVWVCLLDARGQPLVDGQILAAGAEAGPFRSSGFTVSLGNGEVSMAIDGRQAEIPATASPVGYAIGDDGSLEPLAEGERPDCL